MAKYYYKKYASVLKYSEGWERTYLSEYDNRPSGPVYKGDTTNPSLESSAASEVLGINTQTGFYCKSGTKIHSDDWLNVGTLYFVIHSADTAYSCQGNGYRADDAVDRSNGVKLMNRYRLTTEHVAGELVGEVIAEDGTYPENGYNSADGFWYVKDRKATNMLIKSGGGMA